MDPKFSRNETDVDWQVTLQSKVGKTNVYFCEEKLFWTSLVRWKHVCFSSLVRQYYNLVAGSTLVKLQVDESLK